MSKRAASVAIVGGGAVGTSILFHLAKRHDVTDAVLLEGGQVASGSTSRAVGGVRYTFSHPLNVEMGLRNLHVYRNFETYVGYPLRFRSNGYLYVFHSSESQREWETYQKSYQQYDTKARLLSSAETVDVVPALDPEQIRGALWAPDCGHVDPYTVAQSFADAATDRGATVETNAPVADIHLANGSVRAVETPDDTYEVDVVVNAAGAGALEVGEMVGIELPIELTMRRIVVTDRTDIDRCPLVIDREREFYFETEDSGSLLVCDIAGDRHDVEPTIRTTDVGFEYYLHALEKLDRLAPTAGDLEVTNDWAGIQSHTPDGHAIVGPTDVDEFLLACGLSGHGVMQAPSIGAAVSDLVVNGETDVFDADSLRLARFRSDDRIDPELMA